MNSIIIKKASILLFLLLTACGEFQRADGIYYDTVFEAEVKEYLDQRQKHLGDRQVNYDITIVMGFAPLPQAAYCKTVIASHPARPDRVTKTIVVSRLFWYIPHWGLEREQLIFHELGHCDLDRDHIDDNDYDTIMKSNISMIRQYEDNRDYYIHELFNGI